MMLLALLFSWLMVGIGVVGVLAPGRLTGAIRGRQTRALLFAAAAFRIVMGLALFFAGLEASWPDFVQWVGILILLAGILTPFIGVERFERILEWVDARGSLFVRFSALAAGGVGVLLVIALRA